MQQDVVTNFKAPPKIALIVKAQEAPWHELKGILVDSAYDVLTASSGPEALALCQTLEGAVQLLVTDLDLPGESGWNLAEAVSKVCPGIVVLFLSEATGNGDLTALGELATTSPKPVSPATLLKITRSLVRLTQRDARRN